MENIRDLSVRATEALSGIKTKLDKFISQDEAFWMAVAMFLFGVIVGMILSPRRNLAIGSNNTYNTYDNAEEDEDEKDCCKF